MFQFVKPKQRTFRSFVNI